LNGPFIGRDIGHCTITEKLGRGGMAVVYRAHQPSVNRDVAVKILTGPLALDEEFVARFRREAIAAGGLGHPNILTIFDAGTTQDGLHYIVMEYAPGGTLKGRLDRGPLPPDQAREIAAQIADALAAAHEHGIVHRDLKPSNILFSRDGRPLLMDFGVALMAADTRLTRTGMALGTPEYMSPEQAQGLAVDGRSDVYALGILLYEMLTGQVPFAADTPLGTLYQHVHEPAPVLARAEAAVPEWLSTIVGRALSKQAEERYQTADQMATALRAGQAEAHSVASPPAWDASPPEPPRPRGVPGQPAAKPRSRSWIWVVGTIAAAALLLLGTYLLFFRGAGPDELKVSSPADTPVPVVTATAAPATRLDQAATATTVAAAVITADAREAALTREVAEATEAAVKAVATTVALTAEAGDRLAATVTAEALSSEAAAAVETRSAATAQAERGATQTAQAQATPTAVDTPVPEATSTPEPTPTPEAPSPTAIPLPLLPRVELAFVGAHPDENGREIYVYYAGDPQPHRLTRFLGNDGYPAVSADGTLVAFEAARNGDEFRSDIWLMDSDGSAQRRLVSSQAIDAQPAFSPDGRQLAFISDRDHDGNPNDNPMQVYVIQTDGGGLRRVPAPGWCYAPSFSPRGDRLLFVSTSDGTIYRVYSMDLDGSGLQEITHADCHDENPSFSQDGSRIIFDRNCGATRDVYAVNADGSGEVNLTPAQHGGQPTWSQDGSQVIFSRQTDFPHLWLMNPDGSNQRQLTSLVDQVTGEALIGELDPAGAR